MYFMKAAKKRSIPAKIADKNFPQFKALFRIGVESTLMDQMVILMRWHCNARIAGSMMGKIVKPITGRGHTIPPVINLPLTGNKESF